MFYRLDLNVACDKVFEPENREAALVILNISTITVLCL